MFCFFNGVELPAHFLFPVQVPNGLEPAPLTAKYFKINQKKKVSIRTNQLFTSSNFLFYPSYLTIKYYKKEKFEKKYFFNMTRSCEIRNLMKKSNFNIKLSKS
jgi:hypothetical protein